MDSSVVTVAGAGELLLGLLLTHGGQQSLLGPHLLRPPLSLGQALQGRGLQGLPPDIRSGWREANIESVSSLSDPIAHPDIRFWSGKIYLFSPVLALLQLLLDLPGGEAGQAGLGARGDGRLVLGLSILQHHLHHRVVISASR